MAIDKNNLFEVEGGVSVNGNSAGIALVGKSLLQFGPDTSQKVVYNAQGDVDYIEFYESASQTTGNRKVKAVITYSGSDPVSETWSIYDSDGTTVVETRTYSYTYTLGNITNMSEIST